MKTRSLPVAVLAMLLTVFSCSGQQAQGEKEKPAAKPDIRYKVDKQYDSKGNVIRYDSTYTWTYRSGSGAGSDSIARLFFEPEANLLPFTGRSLFPDSTQNLRKGYFTPFDDIRKEHQRMFEEMERRMKQMQELMPPPLPGQKAGGNKKEYEL